MAKVTSPSAYGNIGNLFTIAPDGSVHGITPPYDAHTANQLRYRQLMRALNRVIAVFGAGTDADVIAHFADTSWWSSDTFAEWAANHGTAIDEDLNYYGRWTRCE